MELFGELHSSSYIVIFYPSDTVYHHLELITSLSSHIDDYVREKKRYDKR